MIDFKGFLHNTKETLTSPTAYSWYGVAGVVATGVLTYLSTKKWVQKKYTIIKAPKVNGKISYLDKQKEPTLKDKVTEVANAALIFVPPVAAAAGASYCILHGNHKALEAFDMVVDTNNRLAARLDKYKAFAAGAMTSEVKKHVENADEDIIDGPPHRLYFSDDDLQHEDYGKKFRFCIEGLNQEFVSTPLEVLMAEYEFNKLVWGLRVGEFGSLNELLDMLGAKSEPDGDYRGWSKEAGFDNGYSWVGFNHAKIDFDDGEWGYMICFESEPTYDELFERLIHG